jgi:hypothetical protein
VDTPPLNLSDLGVSELPTGTVTLLLADVKGSTRLWRTKPEEMTTAFARRIPPCPISSVPMVVRGRWSRGTGIAGRASLLIPWSRPVATNT